MALAWTDLCHGYDHALAAIQHAMPSDPFLLDLLMHDDVRQRAALRDLVAVVGKVCDEGEIVLHRQLTIAADARIRWHEIGRAWSWVKDGAYPYAAWHSEGVAVRTYHVVGLAALGAVNWTSTVQRLLECGSQLREIRVGVGAIVDILRVDWCEGNPWGRYKEPEKTWHRLDRHPDEAQVT